MNPTNSNLNIIDDGTNKNASDTKIEVAKFSKRKRLHMDASECFSHVQTEDGAMPLVNPTAMKAQTDPNRRLYPVVRNKRQKINSTNESWMNENPVSSSNDSRPIIAHSLNNHGVVSGANHGLISSQGFVSASNMYNIARRPEMPSNVSCESNLNTGLDSRSPKNKTPSKRGGRQIKQIPNQSSILGFFKSSTPSASEDKLESRCEGDVKSISNMEGLIQQSPSRTVKYPPIKRITNSDTIYISDSSASNSPHSSQSSVSESQGSKVRDNSVVKQLFNAQKKIDLKSKNSVKNKLKRTGTPKCNSFVKKKEMNNIKDEIAKYFESDSFDMNAAFDSDMEDNSSTLCPAGNMKKIKKEKTILENDKYGLLGSGSYPIDIDLKINHFERLPPEVLENIFCHLPMLDLCLNSNRVCLQWNEIIGDEKFVPWKKLYHRLKKNLGSSRRDVQAIMHKNGMIRPANYLDSLIRYMRDFKPVTAANMLQCLQKHSQYSWAKALIEERLTDCLTHGVMRNMSIFGYLEFFWQSLRYRDEFLLYTEGIKKHWDPNPWCVITILVIVSHDVYRIQEVIRCLTVSISQCTSIEILECLYCIATFLYAFKLAKKADVWNGMHYRLFYALYLYENASSSSCADLQTIMSSSRGQQSLVKYSTSTDSVRMTHEQLRIVKHQTRPDEVIKIVAFAGTGKTTTLVRYTQLRPDKKFLLVVYNKSVCEYAKTKFPHNVTCKTGHALAFSKFGRRYAAKLFGIKVYTLTQNLKPRKGDNLFIRAKFVLTTIENFFASADPCITVAHVPVERINEKTGFKEYIDGPAKVLYVSDAEYIWARMQDPADKKVGMSHDGYLKLFQLSKPSLREYDCLLIDEAQDLTPAITDILLIQPQGKILVGDPHQQIYSFRGAVNAMDSIRADTIFYLTQSFRFGPEIAQVASCCLEELKTEKKKTLVGSGNKCTVMGEKDGQLAIICRCNSTVFSEAVKKCCYSDEPCKVAFVGGTDSFGFPMIMDMYALTLTKEERIKDGYDIQNKFIKIFKTFRDLENFAVKSMDNELLGKIKIVKRYHHNLPVLIRKIESKCIKDERKADYVFSTAHKAKGLEFSTVRVTDDFMQDQQPTAMVGVEFGGVVDIIMAEPLAPDQAVNVPLRPRSEGSDEENLLYVAITRAKHALQLSPTILRVLNQAGERFQYPVLSEDLRLAGKTFKCKETGEEFKPKALTLEKKSLKMGEGIELLGGLYSPALLSEDFGSFANLLGLTKEEAVAAKQQPEPVDAQMFYGDI